MADREHVLLERLDRLEGRVRRQRRLMTVLLLLGAVVVGTGLAPPPAKKVEAQTFMLRDAQGNARAKFYLSRQGPQLAIADRRGLPRVVFGLLNETEPYLSLGDGRGAVRARLSLENDVPHLILRDRERNDRLVLSLTAAGNGRLEMFDAQGKKVFSKP